MNQDQALSLIRSLMKLIGSALAAHGVSNSNVELISGIVLAVAGVVWSHFNHSGDDQPPKAGVTALLVGALLVSPLAFTGCGSPTNIAYQTLATIGAAADAGMKAAALAKVNGKITDAQWSEIASAHDKFQAAYDAAVDGAAVTIDQATVPANVAALESDFLAVLAKFNIQ